MLPENHDHSGTAQAGVKIRAKNIIGLQALIDAGSGASSGPDKVVMLVPGMGLVNTATFVKYDNGLDVIRMADGVTSYWVAHTRIPSGCTAISAIDVWYLGNGDTGNFLLSFASSTVILTNDSAYKVDSTLTDTAYAGGATSGKIYRLTAPADSFNALAGFIAGGQTIGITLNRTGGSGLDTNAAQLDIVAIIITFT